jgi:hypothetical protein
VHTAPQWGDSPLERWERAIGRCASPGIDRVAFIPHSRAIGRRPVA